MVTYTPLYIGVPFQQPVSYGLRGEHFKLVTTIGGGFIEPFAWGSTAPDTPPSNGTVEVAPLQAPFGIADASGTSSSAFAERFSSSPYFDVLLPEAYYWPPMQSGTQQASQLFDFGDGGNLDNYGLIPLLMRGVQNIIVFINSQYPLSDSYKPVTTGASSADVDPNLPPFFGVPVSVENGGNPATAYNTVFPAEDYVTLVEALQPMKTAGNPMIHSMTHSVQANKWWGLPGGGTVNVLWVYLDRVDNFTNQLTWDDFLREEVIAGEDGIGPYAHFPNYKTVDDDGFGTLTQLTARQVNLLANLTWWVVNENAATFSKFIGATT